MKRIGVVVAVEINSVLRKYGLPQEEVFENGFKVNIYKNDAFCMYVIDAGAGEISSAISTQYLITKYNCEIIVNFGVVGALTAESKVAELCIVEKVIHYDFDTTGWLNLKTGQYPNHNSEYMNTDELLFEKALSIKPTLKKVVCASADKFVDDSKRKEELNKLYNADICDMEASGVVLTCNRNNVPCILIKAVSDCLTGGGKEFMKEMERVSNICFDVVDEIIRSL